jgi:hypothetical protein
LLARNREPGRRYFTKEDFFLIFPLLDALGTLDNPHSFVSLKHHVQRKFGSDVKRAEFLNRKLSQSSSNAEKRRLRAKVRRIGKVWRSVGEVVGVDLSPGLFVPYSSHGDHHPNPPQPPHLSQGGAQDHDPQHSDPLITEDVAEIAEVRTVRFMSPPRDDMEWDGSSTTTDHELVIDTPDWEDL